VRRTIIKGCHIATCDDAGTEYRSGHVVVEDGRIAAVGAGPVPTDSVVPTAAGAETETVDGSGCLLTPGLVNSHHHLCQWATRGFAQDETLFGWLTTLYPVWAGFDEEVVHAAAAAGLGWLALTGATTSSDHHYLHPRDGGDLLAAEIAAARRIGLRFHPARGSMDLGRSNGGLPPDHVVEDRDAVLAATEAAIDRYHDPSEDSLLRIVVGPCSPFTVSEDLMRESGELARRKGVRMHTHLAETLDEEDYCQEHYGCTPTQYADNLGWLGDDVWMAHCVHLSDDAISRFAQTGTGVAHCPTSNGRLGSGIAPLKKMLTAGLPVGLGVDGAASNESGRMVDELHQALMLARLKDGPLGLTAREALHTGTIGGARCLGRQDEIGSIEPGKLADLALWRVAGLAGDGIEDPVCTLVFGAASLERLFVGGRPIVAGGRLLTADADELGRRRTLCARAQVLRECRRLCPMQISTRHARRVCCSDAAVRAGG
jgi:cytosine/adenosine deaminase-related metal-dependent hydrolase